MRFSPSCKCCGPPTCTGHGNSLAFALTGCFGNPVPGASVTFTGTSASYTRTTDGSGIATVSEPAPDTYTISWSYGSFSRTIAGPTITTGCNSSTGNGDNLTNAAGTWRCCSGCLIPLPATVYLTDDAGTHRLTATTGGWSHNPAGGADTTVCIVSWLGFQWCTQNWFLGCDGTLSYTYNRYDPATGLCGAPTGAQTSAFGTMSGSLCADPFTGGSGSYTSGPLSGASVSP